MNFGFIRYILGWILNFQGIFLLVPCIVALIYGEKSGIAFVAASIVSLAVGFYVLERNQKQVILCKGWFCQCCSWLDCA